MLKKYALTAGMLLLLLTANTLRFVGIDRVPHGFQTDETLMGVALGCLAQDGSSPLAETRYPVFAHNSFTTPTPPVYLYPGLVWVKLFGISQASLRSLTAFAFTIALLGLFAIGCYLGHARCGLWILLAASISPWPWVMTRIAWESLFLLPFLTWGLYAGLTAKRTWQYLFAGALLSGAAYAYPPGRFQLPLLLLTLIGYGLIQLRWKISRAAALAAGFLITSIPLVVLYATDPSLAARFKGLAITNADYLQGAHGLAAAGKVLAAFWANILFHLSGDFLFFQGTPTNFTLSTGHQGVMGWLDILAVLLGLGWIAWQKKNKQPVAAQGTVGLLAFLGINIIIGVMPALLTVLEYAHPLRTIGAWPFAMIATGFVVHKVSERWRPAAWAALLSAVLFAVFFLGAYFRDYPKQSEGWFSIWTDEEARHAKTDQDWMQFLYRYHSQMFVARYYLMRYHGDTCAEARGIWEKLYPTFEKISAQQNQSR